MRRLCAAQPLGNGWTSGGRPTPHCGIEIIYSGSGKTADDVIERMVGESEQRRLILVVTSDNLERQIVETLGAQSVSVELFDLEMNVEL